MLSAEQVGERYLSVHHRMRRAVDDGMAGCGLSLSRTKIMAELARNGPSRQSVLATQFEVAPHTITDVVDSLERDGLAVRQPDPSDRRAKLVTLTEQGESALAAATATRERLLGQVFGSLEAEDRVTMMRLLDVLDGAVATLTGCPPASADLAEPPAVVAVAQPVTA